MISAKEHARRMHVWRHNGLFGKVRRAELTMREIISSPSTNITAKRAAADALTAIDLIMPALKHRID